MEPSRKIRGSLGSLGGRQDAVCVPQGHQPHVPADGSRGGPVRCCPQGNPAAVVMLETELNDKVMQDIAAENNLSETAFVLPNHDEFNIRWFTPTVEVNLCGHATLASAHVIFNHLNNPNKALTFSSKSGLLDVRKDEDILYLDFPVDDFHSVEIIDEIKSGLKSTPIELYKGRDD